MKQLKLKKQKTNHPPHPTPQKNHKTQQEHPLGEKKEKKKSNQTICFLYNIQNKNKQKTPEKARKKNKIKPRKKKEKKKKANEQPKKEQTTTTKKIDKAVDKKMVKKGRDKSGVVGLHAAEVEKNQPKNPNPSTPHPHPSLKKKKWKKKFNQPMKTKQQKVGKDQEEETTKKKKKKQSRNEQKKTMLFLCADSGPWRKMSRT